MSLSHVCCGSISPLVQFGFLLCFITIITYHHTLQTLEQRKIPNCPKGKIEPQHTHYLVWILLSKGIKFDFDNTLYLFAFAGICYSLFGSVTAWNVQYKRASWPRLSSRTTMGKGVSSTSKDLSQFMTVEFASTTINTTSFSINGGCIFWPRQLF